MNTTESLLVGMVLGLAIPTKLIHEWSILMRQRVWTWVKRRRAPLMLAGILVGCALICAAFIISNIAVSQAHEAAAKSNETSACLRAYLGGTLPLAVEKDKAQQALWDDFKAVQTLDPKDKAAAKAIRVKFFADLDAEREANRALQDYRRDHAPAQECR